MPLNERIISEQRLITQFVKKDAKVAVFAPGERKHPLEHFLPNHLDASNGGSYTFLEHPQEAEAGAYDVLIGRGDVGVSKIKPEELVPFYHNAIRPGGKLLLLLGRDEFQKGLVGRLSSLLKKSGLVVVNKEIIPTAERPYKINGQSLDTIWSYGHAIIATKPDLP